MADTLVSRMGKETPHSRSHLFVCLRRFDSRRLWRLDRHAVPSRTNNNKGAKLLQSIREQNNCRLHIAYDNVRLIPRTDHRGNVMELSICHKESLRMNVSLSLDSYSIIFLNLLSGLSIVIRRRTIINIIPVSTLSNLLVHSSAVKPGGGWPRLEKVFFKHTFFGF